MLTVSAGATTSNTPKTQLGDLHSLCSKEIARCSDQRVQDLPVALLFKEYLDHVLRAFVSSTAGTPAAQIMHPRVRSIRRSRLHHPTVNFLRKHSERAIADHLGGLHRTNTNSIRDTALASWLAVGYAILAGYISAGEHRKTAISLRDQQYHKGVPGYERIRALVDQFHMLDEFLIGFYLHGSYATFDAIPGYSDFDAACIVSSATCRSGAALVRLRRGYLTKVHHLYSLDKQQHHELFVLSESELELRTNSYYPDTLWREARRLRGRSELSLCAASDDPAGQRIAFFRLAASNLKYLANPKPANWYPTKNFISGLALLPALYLQAMGQECSKPSAIKQLTVSLHNSSALAMTTTIREGWGNRPAPLPGRTYRSALKVNPQLTRLLGGMRQRTPGWIADQLNAEFWKSAIELHHSLIGSVATAKKDVQ